MIGNKFSRWFRNIKNKRNPDADEPGEVWERPDPETQCGNCHARLKPGDKYCRVCGTKRGEGAYEPYRVIMQCIYGPMPVERTHHCSKCGYSWTTCAMTDDEKYCPMCGGPAPADLPVGRPAY